MNRIEDLVGLGGRRDASIEPRPELSRTLLLPGPLPPLSHLGVTLFRHAAGGGLRYALYHLGLPLPEAPPVKIIRLRPYLEGRALRELLTATPEGETVLGALLEPGGTAKQPAPPRGLAPSLGFHTARLVPFRAPGKRSGARPTPEDDPTGLWKQFRDDVTRLVPRLGDALLADLISALDRRTLRARGEDVPPILSRGAWIFRTRDRGDLRRFGVPDLLAPSWAEAPERAEAARRTLADVPVPGYDRYRGRFREAWRAALTRLAPPYRALAESAARRGLLESPEDAFFLPFDLAEHLAGDHRPSWLAPAVQSNRAEHQGLLPAPEPLDSLGAGGRIETSPVEGDRPEWEWGGLLPLP